MNVRMGTANEIKYYPFLKQLIDNEIVKTEDEYDTFDFESANSLVELKSRNCHSSRYYDTIVGLNKVQRAQVEEVKQCYFVFGFTDGLFVWDFDKTQTDFKIAKNIPPNRNKDYVFIPVKDLRPIVTF